MAFTKLALRGGDAYQRINSAKVKSVIFSDEQTPLQEAEADVTPLLTKAQENSDCYSDEDIPETQQCLKRCHPEHATYAYSRKLKPQRANGNIQLHIHKMDNTSFALEVSKNATVMELKRTLQNKFDSSGSQISWPHVWGNFCLSFNNQKLLDNDKVLHQLGIGNSDELHFVRHFTMSSGQWDHQRRGFFSNMRRKQWL